MQTVEAIIGGQTYNVSNGSLCYFASHDGLGPAPLHRLEERGPGQHGVTDLGVQLDPRIFSLVFVVREPNLSDLYDTRYTLVNLFRPNATPVTWRFTLNNGDVRLIDAFMVSNSMNWDAGQLPLLSRFGFQFKASDPTLYALSEDSVVFALGASSDEMEIPLAIPWKIGQSTINQTRTVTYAGTWLTYPIITIVGPITNAVLTNTTTSEVLDFTGTTIAQGDQYVIDCRYGYKTVTDGSGTNQIAKLSADSDLGTFHLEPPDPGITSKANDFTVTGASANTLTEVYVRYYKRYIGL